MERPVLVYVDLHGVSHLATRLGLSPSEIDRMASAFEHADLRAALEPR